MKKCTTCKIEKELIKFWHDKSKIDGYKSQCKECVNQYRLLNKNLNKINQYAHQYRIDNAEKLKEKRFKNKDKINHYGREFSKQYYKLNKTVIVQKMKQYRQSENGKLISKLKSHKRRLLKIHNTPSGNHWTVDDIKLKLKLQHSKCVYCKISINSGYHIDHIIPLCKGGSNESSNIQLLCKDCNKSGGKGTKDAIEYAQQHGMLC